MIVVIMGVSGSGKTTIGTVLAERAGATFADADDFHPLANKQKMAAGQPLDDADRQPWLELLNNLLRQWWAANRSGVLACSALKEGYRTTLASGMPAGALHFVLLEGSRELIAERLAHRQHEYMNPRLLDSQFRTLEPPPNAFRIVNDRTPAEIADAILQHVRDVPTLPRTEGSGGRRLLQVKSSGEMALLNLFDLTGRTAVVVGGTSGIGLALALGLADAGADVAASSRRPQQVNEAADAIEAKGRKTLRLTSDVAERASLEVLAAETLKAFGKIDILINCAGKTKRAPTVDFPEDEWQSIMDTNVTGTLRACQIVGRHMLERGYGRIINIASLTTFVALTEVAAYACSKAAVGALTRSLAVEWSSRGVTVNAIAPGVFRTALNSELLDTTERGKELLLRTPMHRFGRTEELVAAAIYLASDAASFVTGEILVVDGGFLASGVNQ